MSLDHNTNLIDCSLSEYYQLLIWSSFEGHKIRDCWRTWGTWACALVPRIAICWWPHSLLIMAKSILLAPSSLCIPSELHLAPRNSMLSFRKNTDLEENCHLIFDTFAMRTAITKLSLLVSGSVRIMWPIWPWAQWT